MRTLFISMIAVLAILGAGSATAAERMSVKAEIANVRSGPDAGFPQVWQMEKYHPILVVEKKGGWYRFKDFEGDEGWVHSTLVDGTPTVVVKSNKCNLRNGPGTQFDVILTVDKGVPFKVLEKKGKWLKVQHADGDVAWIFDVLVW